MRNIFIIISIIVICRKINVIIVIIISISDALSTKWMNSPSRK